MRDNDLLICTLQEQIRIATEALDKIAYSEVGDPAGYAEEVLSSIERCEART